MQFGDRTFTLYDAAGRPSGQEIITRIEGSANGPVGDAISHGRLKGIHILRSHGCRVRAIEAGEIDIDVAFMAAPSADPEGNSNGMID